MNIYNNLFVLFLFIIIGYYSIKYLTFIIIGFCIGFYIAYTIFNNNKNKNKT